MFSNLIKSYLSTKIEILLLFFLILIGFLQFFSSKFFVHQDQTLISNYSFGNSLGNGWRPDKGLGYSSFTEIHLGILGHFILFLNTYLVI